MKITIYGAGGCKSCHALHEGVMRVLKDNAIEAEVFYESNIEKIIGKGIMQTPALDIDGKLKCTGRVPRDKEILSLLS